MNTIDIQGFRIINNSAGSWEILDSFGAFLATYFPVFLALFLMIKWFQKRADSSYRVTLLISIIAFILSELLAKLVGQLYSHVQPFAALPNVHQLIEKEAGNSFPSDHTVLIFSFMIVLFLHTKTASRYLYLLAAVLASVSRIFVGVHYPSDVLAGASIAVVTGSVCYYLLKDSVSLRKVAAYVDRVEGKILRRK